MRNSSLSIGKMTVPKNEYYVLIGICRFNKVKLKKKSNDLKMGTWTVYSSVAISWQLLWFLSDFFLCDRGGLWWLIFFLAFFMPVWVSQKRSRPQFPTFILSIYDTKPLFCLRKMVIFIACAVKFCLLGPQTKPKLFIPYQTLQDTSFPRHQWPQTMWNTS